MPDCRVRRLPRFHVYGESFREARARAALSVRAAALLLGVTPHTIRNWERGKTRVPYSAFKLLRISSGYALPGRAWRGWCIRGDTLWSPEDRPFKASDLSWWGLTVAMARAWRHRFAAAAPASTQVASVTLRLADLPSAEQRGACTMREARRGLNPDPAVNRGLRHEAERRVAPPAV